MPSKKTAKYIGFSLVSLSVTTLLLTGIHSFKSYAENTYNVTKIVSGLTIDGADTVNENTDYSFTLTKDDPSQELVAGFVDIENAQYTNFNTQELSLTPKIFPPHAGTKSMPKVVLVEDTDSPLKDAGGYKRMMSVNQDLIPEGDGIFGLYRLFPSSDFWSSKPTAFSLGFWIKDESVTNIIQDKNLQVWPIYQTTDPARYMTLNIPIQELMNDLNNPRSITPGGQNIPHMFTNYTIDAVCLHRTSGWSYFTVNIKDIEYNEGFSTTPSNTRTYILFTPFSASFRDPSVELEMTGITMTSKPITNGHIIYPDTIGEDYKMFLLPNTQTDFTISGQYIYGDMTITARLQDNIPPAITGVENNQVIDLANNPEGVTPNSLDTDIQTITLTKGSTTIPDYQLGQSITMLGSYTLTVTDYSGNITTISFSITNSKKSVYITLRGSDLYTRFDYDDTQDFVEVLFDVTSNA